MKPSTHVIEYYRFFPSQDENLFLKLVECYRKVFGAAPWYEWKLCSICSTKWGIKESEGMLSHCGFPVIDFWPKEKVIDDILNEVTNEASCWLALYQNEVVGFTWGYPVTPFDLEKKLGLYGVRNSLQNYFGNIEYVAYQDELGVLEEWRRQNIAKNLYDIRLSDFIKNGLKVGVVRTQTKECPAVVYNWYCKLGFKTIAEYHDKDKRIILAKKF